MTTINTVNGALDINDLGVTLMHEHVMIGYPGWEADPRRFFAGLAPAGTGL